jgi:hypothetical protein
MFRPVNGPCCCFWSVHCVTSSEWTMFAYSCLLTVYVGMCTSIICNLYTVLRPVIIPYLLTRVYWPYMLSCVRLMNVICTLCYVQLMDFVCLLVSTDRICCHVCVFCMWSVHCVTSSNWTMFAYSCLLTVYVVMCASAVGDLYTVLRPVTDHICLLVSTDRICCHMYVHSM